jgi:hypothetical protein
MQLQCPFVFAKPSAYLNSGPHLSKHAYELAKLHTALIVISAQYAFRLLQYAVDILQRLDRLNVSCVFAPFSSVTNGNY